MSVFVKPTYKIDNHNNNKTTFVFSNLERGFGITLGNSLRRVLFSSISGCSIFAIKISGVSHEFAPIPSVKEDAMQLILNLKQLVIKCAHDKSYFDGKSIDSLPYLKISASGSCVITAKDIECPSGFEIVNKDIYICSLENDNSKLEVSIYPIIGTGFIPFKQNASMISSNGYIAVDSLFSPILHVSYEINETNKLKGSTHEELNITVSTNGAISPVAAMEEAAKILISHFSLILGGNENANVFTNESKNISINSSKLLADILGDKIESETINVLGNNNIYKVSDLSSKTGTELLELKDRQGNKFTKITINKLINLLEEAGYNDIVINLKK